LERNLLFLEFKFERVKRLFLKCVSSLCPQQANQHRDRAAQLSRHGGRDQAQDRSDPHQEEAPDPDHRARNVTRRRQQEQHRTPEDRQEAVSPADRKCQKPQIDW